MSIHAAATALEPVDSMVDVGGYRLHVRVLGGSGVTVVFECGGTLDASQWAALQPKVRERTGAAVVSYDRPGFGTSDLPDKPYHLEDEVAALHRALAILPVPERLILVGHSYGAFNTQLYAARFPKDIDGIVLLDPNTVGIVDAIGGIGQLTFNVGPEVPAKLAQAKIRLRDALSETMAVLRQAPIPDDIPLIVVHAGVRWGATDKFNDALTAGHEALVAGRANHQLIIAAGSGHMINEDRPDLVLDSIDTLVHKRPGILRQSP
jgi:pimeloyl-ACP methyl ester carboxylesterase